MSTSTDHLPLLAALRALLVEDRELWTYEHIAAYSKLEKTYVASTLVFEEGFPAPIRATGPKAHPRYVKAEVITWFEARRGSP